MSFFNGIQNSFQSLQNYVSSHFHHKPDIPPRNLTEKDAAKVSQLADKLYDHAKARVDLSESSPNSILIQQRDGKYEIVSCSNFFQRMGKTIEYLFNPNVHIVQTRKELNNYITNISGVSKKIDQYLENLKKIDEKNKDNKFLPDNIHLITTCLKTHLLLEKFHQQNTQHNEPFYGPTIYAAANETLSYGKNQTENRSTQRIKNESGEWENEKKVYEKCLEFSKSIVRETQTQSNSLNNQIEASQKIILSKPLINELKVHSQHKININETWDNKIRSTMSETNTQLKDFLTKYERTVELMAGTKPLLSNETMPNEQTLTQYYETWRDLKTNLTKLDSVMVAYENEERKAEHQQLKKLKNMGINKFRELHKRFIELPQGMSEAVKEIDKEIEKKEKEVPKSEEIQKLEDRYKEIETEGKTSRQKIIDEFNQLDLKISKKSKEELVKKLEEEDFETLLKELNEKQNEILPSLPSQTQEARDNLTKLKEMNDYKIYNKLKEIENNIIKENGEKEITLREFLQRIDTLEDLIKKTSIKEKKTALTESSQALYDSQLYNFLQEREKINNHLQKNIEAGKFVREVESLEKQIENFELFKGIENIKMGIESSLKKDKLEKEIENLQKIKRILESHIDVMKLGSRFQEVSKQNP